MVLKETAGWQPSEKVKGPQGQMGCVEKALARRENSQSRALLQTLVGESCPNGQQKFSPVKGQEKQSKAVSVREKTVKLICWLWVVVKKTVVFVVGAKRGAQAARARKT
ncbi:unnamed protein product [Rangifer tarandus platyrhynchus]|uniref:Uncharacterized protein n=1 Tax=Rangifer tarandus platyrhynchus TaxID=3082113 RepID=A0AC59YHQ3_RANTA